MFKNILAFFWAIFSARKSHYCINKQKSVFLGRKNETENFVQLSSFHQVWQFGIMCPFDLIRLNQNGQDSHYQILSSSIKKNQKSEVLF